MKYYSSSFICDEGEGPKVHISVDTDSCWPITIKLNTSEDTSYSSPSVIFYLKTEQDLITFKNSIISAYDNLINKRGDYAE